MPKPMKSAIAEMMQSNMKNEKFDAFDCKENDFQFSIHTCDNTKRG